MNAPRRLSCARRAGCTVLACVAVLANAAFCGILSNPHDRYGARIIWLISFTMAIAALQFAAERKNAPQLDPYAPPVR